MKIMNVVKIFSLLTFCLVSLIGLADSTDEITFSASRAGQLSEAALSVEAKQVIKPFARELQHTLKGKLESEGPVAAINVCKLEAPLIADKNSTDGWEISRTALKIRNPNNKPDPWELKTLLEFEQRRASGESVSALESSQLTAGEFRYMKAIPTAGVCTVCHGEQLAPTISDALYQLYPEDAARGFSPGDIRGAFSLRKTLKVN